MEELKIDPESRADGERMEEDIAGAASGAEGGSDAAPSEAENLPVAKKAVRKKKKLLKHKKAMPALAGGTDRAVAAEVPQQEIVFVQLPPRSSRNRKKKFIAWLAMVMLPALLGFLYFQFMASPMYVSHASFAIRSSENPTAPGTDLASIFLGGQGSTGNDTHIVNDYIQSLDIAEDIDKELGIVRHYSDPSLDIISRLWNKPTQDELTSYWQWAVKPELSTDTGIISLNVRAYEPAMAQKITQAILKRSEKLVNDMNARAQDDAVKLAREEVKRAEDRVRAAQSAMREFRDTHNLIDPKATAAGLQSIVSRLESEATSLRTQLSTARAIMREDAPQIQSLKQNLAAVEKQLAEEKKRVAGLSTNQANLNALVADYEDLALEADFAQRQLVSAMASLEQSRIQQISKSRYIVAFQQPTLPDESLYPRPYFFTLLIFVGTLILCSILSLVWAAVREHAGF